MKKVFVISGRNGTELLAPQVFSSFDIAIEAMKKHSENELSVLRKEMDEEEYFDLVADVNLKDLPKAEVEANFPIFTTIPCSSDYIEWRMDDIVI